MDYIKNPKTIEEKSFEIIEAEGQAQLLRFSEDEKKIVKRVIHTTADFEYGDLIEFHPDALAVAKKALSTKGAIYADTSMIQQGVQRRMLKALDVEILNFVHDEDIYEKSIKEGITRSMAGIEKAMAKEDIRIFAIGNAPTALFQIKACIEKGMTPPDLIIGVPVGFVGAVESKEMISDLNIPYIRVNGRKGGSPVAVAILNGILRLL